MSTAIQTGPSWPGFPRIRHLVIFGDSYSSVDPDSHPNPKNPLGVPFPGGTWNEPGKPNWVGHLIATYCHPPRYDPTSDEQTDSYKASSLLVYDYAVGGDTVRGVSGQIRNKFLPHAGKQPGWAPWTSDDTLFVTWVGINDCAYATDHTETHKVLFALHEELFAAGARNFLFIDVPPIHRSPAVREEFSHRSDRFDNWNSFLLQSIHSFSSSHPDITTMLFSASSTFTDILDDPVKYGFGPNENRKAHGEIWHDQLHPTSKVHDIVARDVAKFLYSVEKYKGLGVKGDQT